MGGRRRGSPCRRWGSRCRAGASRHRTSPAAIRCRRRGRDACSGRRRPLHRLSATASSGRSHDTSPPSSSSALVRKDSMAHACRCQRRAHPRDVVLAPPPPPLQPVVTDRSPVLSTASRRASCTRSMARGSSPLNCSSRWPACRSRRRTNRGPSRSGAAAALGAHGPSAFSRSLQPAIIFAPSSRISAPGSRVRQTRPPWPARLKDEIDDGDVGGMRRGGGGRSPGRGRRLMPPMSARRKATWPMKITMSTAVSIKARPMMPST